jgi:hypothetical protein
VILLQVVAKLRANAAAMGRGNAFLYALSRVLDTLFANRVRIVKYYFVAQPVAASAEPVRSRSFSFAWAPPDSPLFSQVERPASIIAARFAQGARCLAATIDGAQLAAFLWFVVGPYDEDEVRARFVPVPEGRTAWDFDVTIMPRYRMGRLFGYLWRLACNELAAHGVAQSVSRISAFNPVSLASHRRLGARVIGQALFLCIGRCELMRSSASPRWHLSWRDDQRPTLRIEC